MFVNMGKHCFTLKKEKERNTLHEYKVLSGDLKQMLVLFCSFLFSECQERESREKFWWDIQKNL